LIASLISPTPTISITSALPLGSKLYTILIGICFLLVIIILISRPPLHLSKENNGLNTDLNASLIYSDDFSSNQTMWSTSRGENSMTAYQDGALHITVLKKDWYHFTRHPIDQLFHNFIVKVMATQERGSDDNKYGVLLRHVNDGNFYVFEIDARGSYIFSKMFNSEWVTIIPLTRSEAINTGNSTNWIKVECKDDMFIFYVNGIRVKACHDNSFYSGNIGLIAESGVSSDYVHVSFDNFSVWEIENS
ncbi:MAG: hypothetical protein PHY05_10045, partial [Methanothrix sp.]|nr:hypothetical protein [Methanothrix sp.]